MCKGVLLPPQYIKYQVTRSSRPSQSSVIGGSPAPSVYRVTRSSRPCQSSVIVVSLTVFLAYLLGAYIAFTAYSPFDTLFIF